MIRMEEQLSGHPILLGLRLDNTQDARIELLFCLGNSTLWSSEQEAENEFRWTQSEIKRSRRTTRIP
jgi:hypothetical protein